MNLPTLSPEQLAAADPKLKAELEAQLIYKNLEASKDHPGEFIDRMLYTFNPKVKGRSPHLPFRLFPFQWNLVDDLVDAIENGYDIFIEKCREMGATYVTLGVLLWYWRFRPGSNFLIGSRKEDYVDNTGGSKGAGELSNKEESLFGKLEYFLARLPSQAKPNGFNADKHKHFASLINPENGNVIGGESSNPNFSRGGRQKAILMDEFAFWDNDNSAWGSTADTTDCRIILTTPGIRPDTKAKRLREGRDGEEIKILTLPHSLDPRKDAAWLANQRKRRSQEDFAREIMINWDASVTGIVYPELKYREVGNFPYEPLWPLWFSWDFGLDGLALQAWQYNRKADKMRLIDAYQNENKPIHFFFPFVTRDHQIDSEFEYVETDIEALQRFKQFKMGVHFGDPDVGKRTMTDRSLKSNRSELALVGIHVQTKPESNSFPERREKTKLMLQKGFEVNDTPGTLDWLDAMKGARYPQRTSLNQATTAIVMPIHNWTSHHRTATEYLAVNFSAPSDEPEELIPDASIPGGNWTS